MIRLFIITLLLCTLGTISGYSQSTDSTEYRVETVDGNVYFGTITERQVEYFYFKTRNIGTIQLRFDAIHRIERISGSSDGKSTVKIATNQSSSAQVANSADFSKPVKYAGSPNAFGLEKGDAYYNNIWVVYNDVQFAISDAFSMGGGFIPVTDVDDAIPMWMNANLSIPLLKNHIHWELSSLHGAMIGSSPSPFGAFFSKLALGSSTNHITLGVGSFYDNGDWFPEPMLHFGGSLKLLDDLTLVSENYSSQSHSIYTGGCQVALGKLSLDMGIFLYSDRSYFTGFPWLGLILPFNLTESNKW